MVGKDYEVGDLVWAKMKGYPFWPGRVEKPPPDKSLKKAHHYIFFFGTKNCAWVSDEFILPHSEEMVEKNTKKKSSTLQSAIDEIMNLSKKGSRKSSVPIRDEAKKDVEKPRKFTQPSPEKKNVKVQKKASVPKKVSPVKVVKKVPKKRPSADSGDNQHSSPPKARKTSNNFAALLANVPPRTGYSRVAVIHPFDDDALRTPPSGGILARPDYIERPSTPVLDLSKVSESLQGKNITATKKKIGFIGLGMMGRGIVMNLINSGHDLSIWNRTPEKCNQFVKAGAFRCMTPSEVVGRCDIVFCCVSDPEAAKKMVFGNCGVLQGLEGCVAGSKGYVEMTSVDPTTSQEIAEAISHVGGRYLEAPISGSRQLAEEGALLILGAGDRDLFNDCESCFFAFSKNAYYLSCFVGSGSKMNLILSMLLGTTYAALAEAMALIERCKLSQGNFLEILDLGPLSCSLLLDKGHAMLTRDFSTNTALKHQQKDLNLALSLGNECDQPMLIASAANELYKHAKLLRYSDHDVSAVLIGAKY